MNLPTVSEIHKTIDDDKFNFYKCGDLSQMVICEDPSDAKTRIPVDKVVGCPGIGQGITPPLKNVKRKRFRIMATEPLHPDRDVNRAVQRLLELDRQAFGSEFEVLDAIDDDAENNITPTQEDAATPMGDNDNDDREIQDPTALLADVERAHGSSEEDSDAGSDAEAVPTPLPAVPQWIPSPVFVVVLNGHAFPFILCAVLTHQ